MMITYLSPNSYRADYESGAYLYVADNQLHRESGPAVKHNDQTLEWYQHGQLHREDGPARIFQNRTVEWWIKGEFVTTATILDVALFLQYAEEGSAKRAE